jgi:hypothetical protein
VFAFNGGERTLQAYKESLDPPLQVGGAMVTCLVQPV